MTEHHAIEVADGESVAAVHHPADGDRWIVFCHGFRSDKTGSYERRSRQVVDAGYQAVRFDFRGCGESDGTFPASTLSSRLADLRAVLDHFDPSSAVCFGSSFGAAVAFHAAVDDERVDAVVGRAPVTYTRAFEGYRTLIERDGECRFDDDTWIDHRFVKDLDRYSFDDVADQLSVPAALFHGDEDSSVPVADSQEAVGALEPDVLFHRFANEGHLFSADAEARTMALTLTWLESVAPPG